MDAVTADRRFRQVLIGGRVVLGLLLAAAVVCVIIGATAWEPALAFSLLFAALSVLASIAYVEALLAINRHG